MKRTLWHRLVAFVLIISALTVTAARSQPATPLDLGTLGGQFSLASALNNRGDVVGRSVTASGTTHGFLWQAGEMIDLGTLPGGTYSEALAVNDRRQVVGWATIDEQSCTLMDGCWHAFLWEDGVMTDLGGLDPRFQSYALGINNRGDIVGISNTADTPAQWHAVEWRDGRIVDLGADLFARAINKRGDIAGSYETVSALAAVAWTRDGLIMLPSSPAGAAGLAYGINDDGQIAGTSNVTTPNFTAVIWTNGAVRALPQFPQAVRTVARAINSHGEAVGEGAIQSTGATIALLWNREGTGATRLAPLVPGASAWASDINDHGAIAGTSESVSGGRAVLWMPRKGKRRSR
jgi:probable HAF family extracellular repeat protein